MKFQFWVNNPFELFDRIGVKLDKLVIPAGGGNDNQSLLDSSSGEEEQLYHISGKHNYSL